MTGQAPEESVAVVAAEAFVFGYPLVLMDVSRVVLTSVAYPEAGKAPLNQFLHMREFPDASFTDVVSPNADTLYSAAWLDLTAEPIVLSVPGSGGRYYLMPMLSGWTDVFASPGTRTTGNGAGVFAVTGPGWSGELPPGVRQLVSPTALVWLIGRTQTNGKSDYASVHRFQDGLALAPLSAWGFDYAPPAQVLVQAGVDTATPPAEQVAAMDAGEFFRRLAELLMTNPPADADAPAIERFAAIGLAPGTFDPDPELADAISRGARTGMERIQAVTKTAGSPTATGWRMFRGLGSYGTDYGTRAVVALVGLGANLDQDAIYPHATTDGDGQPLDGASRYVVHFGPGQTPPANAFWSLTMYNDRQAFVANPIARYAIGDRDQLTYNDDGSLDIWIQRDPPGAQQEPNWLPAPAGSFNIFLRVYSPKQEMLDGAWTPPPVHRLS
jgi:hypothetical protein